MKWLLSPLRIHFRTTSLPLGYNPQLVCLTSFLFLSFFPAFSTCFLCRLCKPLMLMFPPHISCCLYLANFPPFPQCIISFPLSVLLTALTPSIIWQNNLFTKLHFNITYAIYTLYGFDYCIQCGVFYSNRERQNKLIKRAKTLCLRNSWLKWLTDDSEMYSVYFVVIKFFHTIHSFQKLTGLPTGSRGQVTAAVLSSNTIPKVILYSLWITAVSKGQIGRSCKETRWPQNVQLFSSPDIPTRDRVCLGWHSNCFHMFWTF